MSSSGGSDRWRILSVVSLIVVVAIATAAIALAVSDDEDQNIINGYEVSYVSETRTKTTFNVAVYADYEGFFSAYVDGVRVPINDHDRCWFPAGQTTKTCSVSNSGLGYTGLELISKIELKFEKAVDEVVEYMIQLINGSQFDSTAQVMITFDAPKSGVLQVFVDGEPIFFNGLQFTHYDGGYNSVYGRISNSHGSHLLGHVMVVFNGEQGIKTIE